MLRVAVPNKGSLSDPAIDLLTEAGYRQRRDRKDLVQVDPDHDAEFFYLRPRDIATYVGTGTLDVGITGRDLLLDSETDAIEILPLGFGSSTFRFAAVPGTVESIEQIDGRRVATSYKHLVETHLRERGIEAEVVRLDGAVETAVRLGVADVVADVVSTGTTLRQAGLQIIGETLLQSEAVLVRHTEADPDAPQVRQLVRRLEGIMVARRYVIVDYDVRVEHVEAACAITPGIESPTVSPLHDKGWVAVRAMVERHSQNRVMDELWEVGARGIMVTEILSCRL